MEFRDIALDTNGEPREGFSAGANFLSDCGRWRVVASDVLRPGESEWQVWQHVDRAAPRGDARQWRRRLAWTRLPLPDHAKAVAEVLAALPANASWEVARVALRDALRTFGAGLFFRGMSAANRAAAGLAVRLRARRGPSTDDMPDEA